MLVYETVPALEDTWIESLGDLARYWMTIGSQQREVWKNNSRFWYRKAADNQPHVGRLYHHLAIIAPSSEQLFYYCKSLGVTEPFTPLRESILTAFDSITKDNISTNVQTSFIHLHSLAFTQIGVEHFGGALIEFLEMLNKQIDTRSSCKVKG